MKKIVALVLSLVMVLGLATTAFAATPAYVGHNNTAFEKAGDVNLDAYTYSMEAYTPGNAVAKTFDQVVIWKTDKLTGAKTIYDTYTVATADSADYVFVNGTEITYLVDFAGTYTGTVSVLPTVDAEDAEKCGDIFVGDDTVAYTDANGYFYLETAGGAVYNVDGKYVELSKVTPNFTTTVGGIDAAVAAAGKTLYFVAHSYDYDAKTVNGDKTVTAVFCTECDAKFDFVVGTQADAVEKFGAGNYVDLTGLSAKLYAAKTAGTAAVAPEAGDKVESAETFDAGIAMYVGMSVMAAAGSAVVLKKKD